MLKALPKTRGYISLPGQALESKIIKERRTQSSQRIKTEMHAQRGEKVPKTKHYKSKHALSAVSLHGDKTAAGLINGTCLKTPFLENTLQQPQCLTKQVGLLYMAAMRC